MIFNLYRKLNIHLGDEVHTFDHDKLMLSEVREIERVTSLSYLEWERELSRYSITAIAALLHILRKRADMPSDYTSLEFNVADLDCRPVRDDGAEYTALEISDDIARRLAEAEAAAVPTSATAATVVPRSPRATTGTSPSSRSSTASGPGSSTNGSPGGTSASSRRTPTAS